MSGELILPPAAHVVPAAPLGWPGVLHGIDIDVYHAMLGISKTGLDAIDRSPAHFFGLHLDPLRPPPKERAGQLEGTLAHCATLEPSEFAKRYVTVPPGAPRRPTEAQWNAKNSSPESIAAKAWWTEFNAKHAQKTIITAQQYDTAMRQADAIRRIHEVAEALDRRGRAEVTARWIDAATGTPCRCRPDFVAAYGGRHVILLDVKTYSNASAAEFCRQVARKRYHVQDAFYSDGYAAASGDDVMGFVFVVVESEWPFQASALNLDPPSRKQGRDDYRRNLQTYAACRRSGEWPGYGEAIQEIKLPRWAFTTIDPDVDD
jgi:exodeoxyribonuclease VIII